ncbi:MAG TPA: class I SAM-dependent methyltransferase [Anaerolineae bacterium]|nr:class I SAM-dependent methyltransferase [Anaerolineae bacterium]
MADGRQKYSEANRQAWNEAMPYHQRAAKEKWDRLFAASGYSCLDEVELAEWQRLGIDGRAVAHLCCNNGVELLSLKNLGAGLCVGFDIADEAIAEAQERAARCGIDCRFICRDVYQIPAEWDGQFDVVYITAGALAWLPDLPGLMAVAARLLRQGGRVFIHEIHPVSTMLPDDSLRDQNPLQINDVYFKSEPWVRYGDLDYVGGCHYESNLPQYEFAHPLSEIIMALVENGVAVERFLEFEKDISTAHQRQEHKGLPLSYILIGRLGAGAAR